MIRVHKNREIANYISIIFTIYILFLKYIKNSEYNMFLDLVSRKFQNLQGAL